MGFNSAFKGLNYPKSTQTYRDTGKYRYRHPTLT